MEHYTARQVKRAQAQEQLLKRLDQGEDFAAICQELGLHLCKDYSPHSAVATVREDLAGKDW